MVTQKSTPQWVLDLTTQACKDYKRALPKLLSWYNTRAEYSSGHASYDGSRIHVSAGTNEKEAKVVLLHELTHHILSKHKGKGHTVKFWKLNVELNQKYGDIEEAYARDVVKARQWRPTTRAKAVQVFAELGMPRN